jgi:hypothetical protein
MEVRTSQQRNASLAGGVGRHGKTAETYAKAQIVRELHAVLERVGADPALLAIVGSRSDTLVEGAEVLSLRRRYDATGKAMRRGSPQG